MTDERTTDALLDEPGEAAPTPSLGATADTMREPIGVMDPDAIAPSPTIGREDEGSLPETLIPDAIPSAAAIAGHPLHPMIVPLPIGLLAGAFGADLAYVATRDKLWARAALALTAGGVVAGAIAGSVGAVDFLSRARIRERPISWYHAGGNAAVLGLGIASIAARFRAPERAVIPTGLLLSSASAGLLLITGWLGGELVYRYRAAVIPRAM